MIKWGIPFKHAFLRGQSGKLFFAAAALNWPLAGIHALLLLCRRMRLLENNRYGAVFRGPG